MVSYICHHMTSCCVRVTANPVQMVERMLSAQPEVGVACATEGYLKKLSKRRHTRRYDAHAATSAVAARRLISGCSAAATLLALVPLLMPPLSLLFTLLVLARVSSLLLSAVPVPCGLLSPPLLPPLPPPDRGCPLVPEAPVPGCMGRVSICHTMSRMMSISSSARSPKEACCLRLQQGKSTAAGMWAPDSGRCGTGAAPGLLARRVWST